MRIYGPILAVFCRSMQSGSSQTTPSGISFPHHSHFGWLKRFHQAFIFFHMTEILTFCHWLLNVKNSATSINAARTSTKYVMNRSDGWSLRLRTATTGILALAVGS